MTAYALSRFHEVAVPALSEALKDRDNGIRASAAYSLALIGPGAKTAIPTLVPALADKDQQVHKNVASALVRVGAEAVPALVDALKDKNPVIRAASAQVLSEMGPPTASSAVRALTKAMGDESERVRKAATQAYNTLQGGDKADP